MTKQIDEIFKRQDEEKLIDKCAQGKKKGVKMYYKNKFLETFKKLCETRASWQVWADFVTATACALANTVDKGEHYKEREKEYIECAKRNKKIIDSFLNDITVY